MAVRVGYIGLGDMGKPMASNIAPAGFATTVFDLAEEPLKALAADRWSSDRFTGGGAASIRCEKPIAGERTDGDAS